jgi:preprotein translocase subunit SecA
MVELKEGIALTQTTRTMAKISFQQFFSRYIRLAGVSGSLRESAGELATVYGLQTRTISLRTPCRRRIAPPLLYLTIDAKLQAICTQVQDAQRAGRPALIGMVTVRQTQEMSAALTRCGIHHHVLNAANDEHEAKVIAKAGQPGAVTVATNMAGRGTDIRLSTQAERAGGLLLIAAQLNRERRMDRQLIGRTARQGQPGEVRQILSLDQVVQSPHIKRFIRWFTNPDNKAPSLSQESGVSQQVAPLVTTMLVQFAKLQQRLSESRQRRIRLQLLEANESRERSFALSGINE